MGSNMKKHADYVKLGQLLDLFYLFFNLAILTPK